MLGDPCRKAHAELRQQRAVGAHPVEDRLRLDPLDLGAGPEHDPERLPAPELDQHRFARGEVHEPLGNAVRERPKARATGRIDRDRGDPLGGHDVQFELRPAFDDPGSRPSRRG